MISSNLAPVIPTDRLYPFDAAFMARTNLFETRMLGYKALNLDTVTSHLVGLLNGRTAIRHEGGGGEDVFALYRRAGIEVKEETLLYRTPEEADTLADELIAQGKRLFSPYPLPAGRFPDNGLLVPPTLWHFLNAKVNLDALVPPECMPEREILSFKDLASFEPQRSLFLKAAGGSATGWGYAVHPCHDRVTFDNARRWFTEHRDSITDVLVEEWVEVSICWCAGIAISDNETLCFGGAEQIFSSPAKQSGSIIDPEYIFPEEGRVLAVHVGEAARRLGYRGIAGLDMGLRNDGRLIVFDPNFRVNSSTAQLLFHDSAVTRTGHSVTCSFHAEPQCPYNKLAARLEAPIGDGWFRPAYSTARSIPCRGANILLPALFSDTKELKLKMRQKHYKVPLRNKKSLSSMCKGSGRYYRRAVDDVPPGHYEMNPFVQISPHICQSRKNSRWERD